MSENEGAKSLKDFDDEQSTIHDTIDALKSIMQEPHVQRYYARAERLAADEAQMTDNDKRPTQITAAQLAAEWDVWRNRLNANEVEIIDQYGHRILGYLGYSFVVENAGNFLADTIGECQIRWLTPAPAKPANGLQPHAAFDFEPKNLREVALCNAAGNIIDELEQQLAAQRTREEVERDALLGLIEKASLVIEQDAMQGWHNGKPVYRSGVSEFIAELRKAAKGGGHE